MQHINLYDESQPLVDLGDDRELWHIGNRMLVVEGDQRTQLREEAIGFARDLTPEELASPLVREFFEFRPRSYDHLMEAMTRTRIRKIAQESIAREIEQRDRELVAYHSEPHNAVYRVRRHAWGQ